MTEPKQCAKLDCPNDARSSVFVGSQMHSACPEHYRELLAVLGVDGAVAWLGA